MLPRAVLFDLDGTLIDSIPLILSSMQAAFAGHPRPPSVAEWTALIGTPLDAMIRRWAVDEADVERIKERYKTHQWAHHDAMVRAFPGVPEMLATLRARGIRMAVVTSKLEPSARRSLDFLGLSGHFELVVGLEATERHKPDPAPVHHAIDVLGARPGEAAFVGDSPHDIEAGNAAGVATVATLWGPFSREELSRARPRAWAERVPDVIPALEGLGIPGL
ncbi:MAG TPA: HAD-IA family hydrolase [Anaeromyxobacteraceae bacterium]|nr:HAD-IA family hydrolase [Anaeromyxobacteraceae bacterium]